MEPYAGRTASPKKHWPMTLATLSLIFLAIIIPIGAFLVGIVSNFSLSGQTPTPDRAQDAFYAVLVGLISGALAVIAGIVAIFAGRGVGVRVVAVVAILVGLFTGGIHSLFVYSYIRSTTPPVTAPEGPSCGPGSHPAVFGGDSRYTACPDDLATADDFLEQAVDELPVQDVTPASVDAVASQLGSEFYDGTYPFDDGTIVVAWYPAPVTCALATWSGESWNLEATGALADGGCVYGGEK